MKLTGPTMSSYPVFPNWVFEGKVELTKEQRTGCLEHATKLDKVETTFGWATKIGNIQDEMFTLSNLTGQMFFNNVVSHFRLSKEFQGLDSCENQFIMIKPGQCIPPVVNRLRWYNAVVFIEGEDNSHALQLNDFTAKQWQNPSTEIQEYSHIIPFEPNKVIFFPSHIPWGFTSNSSKSNTLIFVCNYFMNHFEGEI